MRHWENCRSLTRNRASLDLRRFRRPFVVRFLRHFESQESAHQSVRWVLPLCCPRQARSERHLPRLAEDSQ
jgi:hypothetical protein